MDNEKMNYRDKALLESLTDRYGEDAIVDQVLIIAKQPDIASAESDCQDACCDTEDVGLGKINDNLKNCILEFIKKLEGYRIRTREFHWDFDSLGRHKNRDEIMDFLLKIEDDIAEDMMGFFGVRIKPGDIVPVLPKATDTITMLCELAFDITKMKHCVEGYPECYGISSILDDMMHNCNKYRYLESRKQ